MTFYHVDDAQPPSDAANLCERLEPIDEDSNHASALVDRVVSFDLQERALRRWLNDFGVEERQYGLLQDIDADKDKQAVFDQIVDVVEKVMENKKVEKESMREMFVIKIKQLIEEKQRQVASQEMMLSAAEGAGSIDEADMHRTGEISKMSKDVDTARKSKAGAETSVEKPEDASKSELKGNPSNASIHVLPDRDNIDNDFKPVIIEVWRDLAKNYKSQMKRIFRNIRMQREQASIRNSEVKMQFLEFLHTFDGKQAILDEFVKNFNEFSDQYPDLREDDQTKEELHQRTDALSDELWEIVEERKEQSIEFRKKIMENGYVEFKLEFMT